MTHVSPKHDHSPPHTAQHSTAQHSTAQHSTAQPQLTACASSCAQSAWSVAGLFGGLGWALRKVVLHLAQRRHPGAALAAGQATVALAVGINDPRNRHLHADWRSLGGPAGGPATVAQAAGKSGPRTELLRLRQLARHALAPLPLPVGRSYAVAPLEQLRRLRQPKSQRARVRWTRRSRGAQSPELTEGGGGAAWQPAVQIRVLTRRLHRERARTRLRRREGGAGRVSKGASSHHKTGARLEDERPTLGLQGQLRASQLQQVEAHIRVG
jgi:hypothetical protein